jgi:hypothetical protein
MPSVLTHTIRNAPLRLVYPVQKLRYHSQNPVAFLCCRDDQNRWFQGRAIFAKQNTKNAEQEDNHHVIKGTSENNDAIPDSTRSRIDDGPLRADHRRLFVLYWAAQTWNVLVSSETLCRHAVGG